MDAAEPVSIRRVMPGGPNLYGHSVGILLLEGRFPRPPGAIGNARTFPFPVLHHVVPGASGERLVRDLPTMDPEGREFGSAVSAWIDGARHLEAQGCKAIVTSCGFAVLLQAALAEAVSVPVWSSSLMLGPLVLAGLAPDRRLGLITAEASAIRPAHLAAARLPRERVAIIGMEGCPEFAATAWADRQSLDLDLAEDEAVSVARRLTAENRDLGAILLECSLLPPYAAAIQAATAVPVFDFTHLVTFVHSATSRGRFD